MVCRLVECSPASGGLGRWCRVRHADLTTRELDQLSNAGHIVGGRGPAGAEGVGDLIQYLVVAAVREQVEGLGLAPLGFTTNVGVQYDVEDGRGGVGADLGVASLACSIEMAAGVGVDLPMVRNELTGE